MTDVTTAGISDAINPDELNLDVDSFDLVVRDAFVVDDLNWTADPDPVDSFDVVDAVFNLLEMVGLGMEDVVVLEVTALVLDDVEVAGAAFDELEVGVQFRLQDRNPTVQYWVPTEQAVPVTCILGMFLKIEMDCLSEKNN